MTDNYKIEKSIVTIPYTPNRDDRTDLFTDAGTKNQVISASNEGTVYFIKDSTEHIILTGSWFDEEPEVNPLHFVKENGCLLYTSPSPRDLVISRMPSSA